MGDDETGDVSLLLTEEELSALRALAGSDQHQCTTETVRALIARGLVDGPVDTPTLPPAVDAVIGLMLAPVLAAVVQRTVQGSSERRWWFAEPDLAVDHAELPDGFHALVPHAAEETLIRMIEALQLPPTLGGWCEPAPVEVDVHTARRVVEGGTVGTGSRVPSAARSVAEAVALGAAVVEVEVLHRVTESEVRGGTLRWIDTGEAGLWLVPTGDELDGADPLVGVVMQAVGGDDLAAGVASFFPGDGDGAE